MDLKKEKIARFYPDEKQHSDEMWERTDSPQLQTPSPLYKASAPLLKSSGHGRHRGRGGVRSKITGSLKFRRSKVFPEDHEPWGQKILDPGSGFFLRWNWVFLFSSLVALMVDPLFLYLPVVVGQGNSSCMKMDLSVEIVATCLRTVSDLFYLLHILIKFRTAYIAPNSRGFGRGELVMESKKIAWRYLRTDFFVDLAAALPLPQVGPAHSSGSPQMVIVWFIIPSVRTSHTDHTNNALLLFVLLQYIPRLYQIFPLGSDIIKDNGVIAKTAWTGAMYNLLLYLIASHVFGASWYLLSTERYTVCWKSECRNEVSPLKCSLSYLDCESLENNNRTIWAYSTVVFNNCDASNQNITFNYGIFGYALSNNVASVNFFGKYFFCFWWGLQQLSCYAQTLLTSSFIEETSFSIIVALMGLVLFAHLIGNMQTYLASITARLEEWRLKQRDTEEWMRHHQLPQDLRERVRKFLHYKWLATRGVDEEAILEALPNDLRRDIQCHLCLDLVRRVPFFKQMDDQLLDAICERLVSSLSTEGTYIVREGDPVTEMLFIIRGRLESSTTDGGRTGFFNSIILRPGDFCGEELLAWTLLPQSTINLPSSTRTVKALSEVEAFALQAEHLKFVANQFRRLHSKKLQHTFRYYSHHWRTWATCFIQSAWRQYKRRKMAKELCMQESLSFSFPLDEQVAVATGQGEVSNVVLTSSSMLRQNLGELRKSRFAMNTRMGVQKIKGVEIPLQKPEEPDFS